MSLYKFYIFGQVRVSNKQLNHSIVVDIKMLNVYNIFVSETIIDDKKVKLYKTGYSMDGLIIELCVKTPNEIR